MLVVNGVQPREGLGLGVALRRRVRRGAARPHRRHRPAGAAGPERAAILAKLTAADLDAIRYYHFAEGEVDGVPAVISRTGYTGEDGFELYVPAAARPALWRRLLEVGAEDGLAPCGLGSRDSLRLEMGMALYGNDLDEEHTPLEAGLGWVTKLAKGDFVGRDALARQKERGRAAPPGGLPPEGARLPPPALPGDLRGAHRGRGDQRHAEPHPGRGDRDGLRAAEAAKPGTEIGIVIRDRAVPGRGGEARRSTRTGTVRK
jgi:aminomethyltransferase